MDLANYLMGHPEYRHGKIRILFTPDEEIGRGVDQLDMQRLGRTSAIRWMPGNVAPSRTRPFPQMG